MSSRPDSRARLTSRRRWRAAGVWAVVCWCAWLLFVGEWTALVAYAGVGAAVVAALGARLLSERGLSNYTFRAAWLGVVPSVLRQVAVDFWILTRELARSIGTGRRTCGRFVGRPLHTGGDTALGASYRAWVTVAATWSPNAYVVHVDREHDRRLSHDLVVHRPSERPA